MIHKCFLLPPCSSLYMAGSFERLIIGPPCFDILHRPKPVSLLPKRCLIATHARLYTLRDCHCLLTTWARECRCRNVLEDLTLEEVGSVTNSRCSSSWVPRGELNLLAVAISSEGSDLNLGYTRTHYALSLDERWRAGLSCVRHRCDSTS